MSQNKNQLQLLPEIPFEAHGVKWPMKIYICQSCSRPTMWREDKCCSGYRYEVDVWPLRNDENVPFTLIEELNLTSRAYNCLRYANIRTVEDLITWSEKEIRAIPNVGDTTFHDIKVSLRERGLELKKI